MCKRFKIIRAGLLGITLFLPIAMLAQNAKVHEFPTAKPEALGFSEAKLKKMQQDMQRYVDERKLAGIVTLVARQGKVVHAEKYGMQEIENERPIQLNTIFRMASMTKPLTSVAVMMLYEQGRLKLDDPVSKFIPAFAETKVYATAGKLAQLDRPITIKDLLMHTSGITASAFGNSPVHVMYREADLGSAPTLDDFVSRLASLPLLHQPGGSWSYGLSTDVLARVVEVVSGIPFDRFLVRQVIEPLKMYDTDFMVPKEKRGRFAALYKTENTDGLKLVEAPTASEFVKPPKFPRGNTGIVSTALDYFRFAQMLLNGGELDDARLLKRESVALMTRNHLPENLIPLRVGPAEFTNNGFGLGFSVVVNQKTVAAINSNGFWWNRGTPPVGSYWWVGAYQTYFWIDPQNEIVGVFMAQSTDVMKYPFMQEFHTLVYEAFGNGQLND